MAPAIGFVPFGDYRDDVLADIMHRLVYCGADTPDPRLLVDFPQLGKRYSLLEAKKSVRQQVAAAAESRGKSGSLMVTYNGAEIGVMTFEQRTLTRRTGWWIFGRDEELANGPLMAGWLVHPTYRLGAPKGLLPQVLRAAARLLVDNAALSGHPWTLVRASRNDRSHVDRCLLDINNGFGSFNVVAEGEFPEVDGRQGHKRKLYVARHPVELLRG